jgi:SulP family sulfate permease
MLVPQGMAYAMLAGLPPEMGLYSSVLPLLLYFVWGTSSYLSVAPVAITSLFVASGVAPLAGGDPAKYLQLIILLAFLEGCIQILMGVFRLGFIANFMSRPVITGYISAAALTILMSQLGNLTGAQPGNSESFFGMLYSHTQLWQSFHLPSIVLSVGGLVVLVYFKFFLEDHLRYAKFPRWIQKMIPKSAPLYLALLGIILAKWGPLHSDYQVSIVETLPTGFPTFAFPLFTWGDIASLLPLALGISLISFMESLSVGKTLAYKEGKDVNANKELVALGLSGIGSAFSGGYSVSGSLSRSAVNQQSGAHSKFATLITAGVVGITILFLMPYLSYLPRPILAAIIVVAISSMIDIRFLWKLWPLNKADGLSFLITFLSVLLFGVKYGLLIGILTSMILYMWVTSRPHIAIIGRVGNSEHFRNVLRHEVTTHPHILTIRIDENLTFANAKFFEAKLLELVKEKHQAQYFVLNASNINYIDTSALETLEFFFQRLYLQGIQGILSEVKGPVMDFLKKTGFAERFGEENIYLSTHMALESLQREKE